MTFGEWVATVLVPVATWVGLYLLVGLVVGIFFTRAEVRRNVAAGYNPYDEITMIMPVATFLWGLGLIVAVVAGPPYLLFLAIRPVGRWLITPADVRKGIKK